jgi:hypothetical protein
MDKISFFVSIDFDQIPVLKHALIESKIWETKQALDNICKNNETLVAKYSEGIEQRTTFVKNFFDKLEKHQVELKSKTHIKM